MADAALLNVTISLAAGAAMAAAAVLIAFVPPASTPKRLLALVLALAAFRELASLRGLGPPEPPGTWGGFVGFFFDVHALQRLAVLAFLAVFPAMVRWRSAHGAVFVLGALVVLAGLVAGVADKGLLYDPAPGELEPGRHPTLLGRLLVFQGPQLAQVAAVASVLLRARALPEGPDRRTALLVPPLLLTATVAGLGSTLTLGAMGLPVVPTVPGDCCGVYLATRVAGDASVLALAAWLALRWRAPAMLGVLLLGVVMAALPHQFATTNLFPLYLLIPVVASVRAVLHHGAFGTPAPPGWVQRLLAAILLVAVFVGINAAVVAEFEPLPLAAPLGIFLGIAGGVAAALVAAPGATWLAGTPPAPSAPERLAPYRTAMLAEVGAGASPEALAAKLRPLRADLGISEQEHAVLEFALRAGRSPVPAAATTLAPGTTFLGRYRVVRLLGQGGLGATHLCRDERVGRDVVLKTLRSPERTPEALAELLREARALGGLRHPHVVTLHDVEEVGDQAFLIMEHLPGGSLADRLGSGRALSPADFARLARDLLAALGAVHAAGQVHRDVKPSNILFTDDGTAKLADFGVAHLPGFETTVGRGSTDAVGTVRFMSPEQARGKRASPRSDLYSAAVTLYEARTGRPLLAPLPGESATEVQMRAAFPKPFAAPLDGSPALRAWFRRALAPAPEDRFADAAEMLAALERASEARGGPGRRRAR